MFVRTSLPWISAVLLALVARPTKDIRVQPDDQNIVSGLIEGTWVPDEALDTRLGNRPGSLRMEFVRDDTIAKQIPAKYEEFLGKKIIFAAGTALWKEGDAVVARGPFLVIEQSGNPHVVMFRPRGDEPLGDAESGNVVLVRAKERSGDILFLGGDTAGERFRAFRREVTKPK